MTDEPTEIKIYGHFDPEQVLELVKKCVDKGAACEVKQHNNEWNAHGALYDIQITNPQPAATEDEYNVHTHRSNA